VRTESKSGAILHTTQLSQLNFPTQWVKYGTDTLYLPGRKCAVKGENLNNYQIGFSPGHFDWLHIFPFCGKKIILKFTTTTFEQ
jgi:hypothetical protein